MSEEEMTCGKGLAAHSSLPRKIAAVAAAMAEMLEHHRTSLDVADPAAEAEDEAYETLASEFRGIASSLESTADRMAGYRDLPMAPHDEAVLETPEAVEIIEHLVRAERELMELLQSTTATYEGMLSRVRPGNST